MSRAVAHAHVELVYRGGQLRLLYYEFELGELDPADLILPVGLAAARPVPDVKAYTDLLGEAGSTVWILPQSEAPDLLWLGVGAGSLRAADFAAPLQLQLVTAEGPGHFVMFFTDALGRPQLVMSTRDGLDDRDRLNVPAGGHLHCNWAFSLPGRYRLRFQATGTLRSGSLVTSPPADFFFEVVAPPAPRLDLFQTPTNALLLILHAYPGLHYVVEHSMDLTKWSPLSHVAVSSPLTPHPLVRPPRSVEFYRVRLR